MDELRCGECESLIDVLDRCEECMTTIRVDVPQRLDTFVRTECKQGHSLTEENSFVKLSRGVGYLTCQICYKASYRKYYDSKGRDVRKAKNDKSKQS